MRACVEWAAKQARSSSYLNCFALKRKLVEKPSMTSQKLKKKKKADTFTSVVRVNKPLRGCFGVKASDSSDC